MFAQLGLFSRFSWPWTKMELVFLFVLLCSLLERLPRQHMLTLLDRLLGIFKQKLGSDEHGEEIDFSIGNTDNDPRECTSLSKHWPGILLLLCMFHIWQAWRNMLNRRLQPIPKGEQRQLVRKRLGKLLMDLLKEISEHAAAMKRFTEEVDHWKKVGRKRDASSKCQGLAALDFLSYIKTYIENEAYWISWSPAGAIEAARRLKVPVSRTARTTNPLESFNGRIKGKYYKPYQHSGRLPRIDVWILLLVTAVMPDFFKERENKKELNEFYASKRILITPHYLHDTASPFIGWDISSFWLIRQTDCGCYQCLCYS